MKNLLPQLQKKSFLNTLLTIWALVVSTCSLSFASLVKELMLQDFAVPGSNFVRVDIVTQQRSTTFFSL